MTTYGFHCNAGPVIEHWTFIMSQWGWYPTGVGYAFVTGPCRVTELDT